MIGAGFKLYKKRDITLNLHERKINKIRTNINKMQIAAERKWLRLQRWSASQGDDGDRSRQSGSGGGDAFFFFFFCFDAISDAINYTCMHAHNTSVHIFNAPDSSNVQLTIAMLCRCLLFPYTKYYSNRFLYPVHLISSCMNKRERKKQPKVWIANRRSRNLWKINTARNLHSFD